jgi:hypothetical protein
MIRCCKTANLIIVLWMKQVKSHNPLAWDPFVMLMSSYLLVITTRFVQLKSIPNVVFSLFFFLLQLPPLIRNEEAKERGMEVSLFKRLSEAHPNAVVNLEYQYRMNKDIMLLSNTLVYDFRLRCGNPEVAEVCVHGGGRFGWSHELTHVFSPRKNYHFCILTKCHFLKTALQLIG